ncbi:MULTISPECIES: hypothetical protein [unclassified Thioalkalivibrio]|uniref:hypothetical protein n=1 Tax=unclassified Thioalkalivibrio TaxID=2621013 RepID=UPI001E318A59|nr:MULTISPECIES: hypothetical protein [unclassified Thioalkalivibrio]
MDDITEMTANDDYTNLRPLLASWLSTVQHYCEHHEQFDNCWWHIERASISILAGAAWRLSGQNRQWAALEEFATRKRVNVDQDVNGRCDLYISNKDESYAIEAKQAWQSIGNRSSGATQVQASMKQAWDDAGKLSIDEADYRLAVTFVVPYIPLSEGLDEKGKVDLKGVREKVNTWLEDKRKFERARGKPTAYACYFPYDCSNYRNEQSGRLFPGVVIVTERRLRGN